MGVEQSGTLPGQPQLGEPGKAETAPRWALPKRGSFGKGNAAVSSPISKTVNVRKPSFAATGCMFLFFGIFFIAGIALVYVGTIKPVSQAILASNWRQTPCVVDSSQVKYHRSSGRSGGTTYSVGIVYHYTFDGNIYTASRYQFQSGSSGGRTGKQRIVDQYPPGRETVCYVNPSNPSEAVLKRGFNAEMLLGLFGLLFAGVGAVGLRFFPRLTGTQVPIQKNAVPTADPAGGEPVELKPQITPFGKFLLLLAFAVVWNGLTSVFVYLLWFAPNHHNEPLFAKIIIGFFAFIGVLILLALVGSFLAIFNPQVVLNARTKGVPLGGVFEFEWSIRGRAGKLRKLRAVLEGREEAVYFRGKSAYTSTQVFAEIPVFETMDNEPISQGHGRVAIPSNLMHSFNGRHNKIIWRIKVSGQIPKWPDLEQDYTINVLPHRPNV